MKKIIAATVLASLAMGSAANAWGYDHCKTAADFGASSGTLAKHCAEFIAPQGQISFGKHKNKHWKDVFPKAGFKSQGWVIVSKKKGLISKPKQTGSMLTIDYKRTWYKNRHQSLKTKQVSELDGTYTNFKNGT